MTVRKRGKVWWYDFGNHKYRGPIPEARTKYEAEQAEIKLKRDVFEGKYGRQFGTMSFAEFVGDPDAKDKQFGEGTFLEWSKNNKRSWKHDLFRSRSLLAAFKGKTLGEITPVAIERFKNVRRQSSTKRKRTRSAASVNLELQLLSRIFTLAIRLGLADSNPCSRVSKFKLQNQRHRYLLPDEEPLLLAQCTGKREHLATMVPFAIATGARKSEQLNLRVRQIDFFRNLVLFDKTKSGRKLMGHASISTSQRYVRNVPVGAGEAVMLKNQRRHNTVTTGDSERIALVVKS